ncbi:hypothetical protein [Fodinibius sediminis]|nr:hypothetical protein [Fodinibius sediminis]
MKNYKLLLMLAALCLLGTDTGTAQKSEAFINQIENPGIDHNSAVREFSLKYASGLLDMLNETGLDYTANNQAVIHQRGNSNQAILHQYGSDNTSIINMTGDRNFAKSTQQGNALLSIINMEGNRNALDFMQQGENRGAFFLFQGNDIQYDATQTDNIFNLTPQNSTTPAFNIQSTRRNLPVIIRKN